MKRTVEVVLTVIGAVVYAFGALFGGLFRMMDSNPEFMDEAMRQDPQLEGTQEEVNAAFELLGSLGTFLIVVSIIAIIAGIIACILYKGDNKPKIASIIVLVIGVISTLITFGLGIFAGIFYVIAGIMGLVRKPKPEVNMEQY
ncbi:DUF4064 domain-containing protein [Gracilibacillus timonensis]|uniref:DUF4064 domain-containing protein n=1 Tax=Gracilibacillus timonensis TaxID=1816696 RepID=UPI0008258A50|nr:DUF4064 domain-containing protein [Gracilibacillus timonensis]